MLSLADEKATLSIVVILSEASVVGNASRIKMLKCMA